MSDKKISELPIASAINATDLSVLVSSGTNYQYAFSTLLQFISSGLSVGANISFGTTLPQNTDGKNGDVFINTSAGTFAQKATGTWAVVYTLPSSGSATDGTVLYGIGVPASSIGNNNDTYINTGTGIFYKKSSGAWSQVFSMQSGPAGPAGSNGTNGTNGANGKTILNGTTDPSDLSTGTDGDFYINTTTLTFFGPKTGGVWPAGNSLAGADGATGTTGAAGAAGATGATGATGAAGPGVPAGGTTGQVLSKIDGTDYHTAWETPSGGGGVSGLTEGEILFGKSDGTIEQDSNLRFDPSTKSLYVGDTPSVPGTPSGNIYFFGDSIAVGTGASDGSKKFSTILSGILGLTEHNFGVVGSSLEGQTPADPSGAASMISRLSDIPTKGSDDKYIIFVYGVNDVRFVSTNYNATNFQTDYETVIDACISKGWAPSEILITSTTYVDPLTYSSPGDGGTPNPSLSRQQAFNSAALAVSAAKGTMYAEIFDYVANRGGIYNLSGFLGIHPNNTGHALIAAAIIEVMLPNVYATGQGLATSRIVEFLNLVVNTKYVLPDNSQPIGVDTNGKIGKLGNFPAGMRIQNPALTGNLNYLEAWPPSGIVAPVNSFDWLQKLGTVIRATYDGQPWEGSIQLFDSGGSQNFRIGYGGGSFFWYNGDGTNRAMQLDHYGRLILDNAGYDGTPGDGVSTAENGDIVIPIKSATVACAGSIAGRFIPLNASNHTQIWNNDAVSNILFSVSGGTNGGELDVWKINPDGSMECLIVGQGIIMKSSDGTRYKITVANGGTLSIATA